MSKSSGTKSQNNRRRHVRIAHETCVHYAKAKGPTGAPMKNAPDAALSQNVSAGGIFIRTKTPCPINTRLDLRLSVPSRFLEVEATGHVTWISKKRGEEGMGLEFDDIDPIVRYDLMRGVKEGGWLHALGVMDAD